MSIGPHCDSCLEPGFVRGRGSCPWPGVLSVAGGPVRGRGSCPWPGVLSVAGPPCPWPGPPVPGRPPAPGQPPCPWPAPLSLAGPPLPGLDILISEPPLPTNHSISYRFEGSTDAALLYYQCFLSPTLKSAVSL